MIDFHRELLADETRTRAYRDAIRATVRPGDVVLDLGCGSGILSFFALEAGAARVYAIDRGHMADVAQFLSRHLGFADRMTVLHEPSTNVELPERADVLVTETMGVMLFDENMLSSVLDARGGLLHDNFAVIPQSGSLSIVPVEVPGVYERHIGFWSEPLYGLDLSPLRVFASNSLGFVLLDPASYVATPQTVIDVDLRTFDSQVVSGLATFPAGRDAFVHGFGVWFDVTLAEGIGFSTREPKSTHWAQALLPLETPLVIARGEEIEVHLETDDGRVWRWRGHAAGTEFDQTTIFAAPPCARRD